MNFLLDYFIPHAHAYNYFDFSDVASSTMAFAGGIISDLAPVWIMVFGILFGMIIVSYVVGLLTKHK
jgi:hypothetical protein